MVLAKVLYLLIAHLHLTKQALDASGERVYIHSLTPLTKA
jgi:hypothetical protein